MVARAGGRIIAAAPLYAKSHSQGEYIFDFNWADAWQRAGGRYYPKLQIAVPFTPATGRRFLTLPGQEAEGMAALVQGAIAACRRQPAVLAPRHVLHGRGGRAGRGDGSAAPNDPAVPLGKPRLRQLSTTSSPQLSSRKRKALRKERAQAQALRRDDPGADGRSDRARALGCVLDLLPGHRRAEMGHALPDPRAPSTSSTRPCATTCCWSWPSGTASPVAGALNFIGRETLYGRYWGCIEDHPFLHFELCYHQAIDWAIAQRLEAGRGRGAGRTQAGARLSAGAGAFAALDRRSGVLGRRRPLSGGGAARRWVKRSRC